jgi:hypothetical protein
MDSKIVVFLLIALFLITPAPMISSVQPDFGLNNGPVDVYITGDKFDHKVTISLTKSGEPDIVATNIKMISKKEFTCSFDLANKSAGKWDLVVAKKSLFSKKPKTAILVKGFDIQYPAPMISKIQPNQSPNSKIVMTNISGANFREGVNVELSAGEQKIKATNPKVLSDTQLTADFNLVGIAPGVYDVKVTNDDGQSDSLAAGFDIGYPAPTVSEIEPSEGLNSEVVTTNITGTNFRNGAEVGLSTGDQSIQATDTQVISDTQISAEFDLAETAPGTYDVKVSNDDGQSGSLAAGFNIKEAIDTNPDGQSSALPSGVEVEKDVPSIQELNDLLKPIFFDFDKSDIRPDQIPSLEENA